MSPCLSQGELGSVALCSSLWLWVADLKLRFQNCLLKTSQAGSPARTSSLESGTRIRWAASTLSKGTDSQVHTQNTFHKAASLEPSLIQK